MTVGTVKFFNETKGYGFIAPDGGGNDAFVHMTAVERAGMRSLRENQRVSYDLQQDNRGKMSAVNLKAAENRRSPKLAMRAPSRQYARGPIVLAAPIVRSSNLEFLLARANEARARRTWQRSRMCANVASDRSSVVGAAHRAERSALMREAETLRKAELPLQ